MSGKIGRRSFVTLAGGAAAAALVRPRAARADEPAIPAIGALQIGPPSSYDFSAFRRGLKDAGFVDARNVAIEYRWANDDPKRLPELAADLVHRNVRVIVSFTSSAAVQAAMAATPTIPIVFGFGADPVQLGLVASLNQPGGNVTGMTSMSSELVGKQLGILHDLLPQASRFGVLVDSSSPTQDAITKDAQAAAPKIGVTTEPATASTDAEINAAIARLADQQHAQGVLVSNAPLFLAQRIQICRTAANYKLPAIYPFRAQAKAGGLMSYGPDLVDRDRQVGQYAARILKGDKPASLPVLQSTKFEFVINLKTAKALGLKFSSGLLSIADEAIE